MTKQIKFSSGHCIQNMWLSKPEVEALGPLIHAHLDLQSKTEDQEDFAILERQMSQILDKLDYPAWEKKND
jgi:hypothetical protein